MGFLSLLVYIIITGLDRFCIC